MCVESAKIPLSLVSQSPVKAGNLPALRHACSSKFHPITARSILAGQCTSRSSGSPQKHHHHHTSPAPHSHPLRRTTHPHNGSLLTGSDPARPPRLPPPTPRRPLLRRRPPAAKSRNRCLLLRRPIHLPLPPRHPRRTRHHHHPRLRQVQVEGQRAGQPPVPVFHGRRFRGPLGAGGEGYRATFVCPTPIPYSLSLSLTTV